MNKVNQNESSKRIQVPLTVAFSLVVACLVGCESAGYKKSDVAAWSSQDAAVAIQSENSSLDVTLASLNDLADHPAPDVKPQFLRFSADLDALGASAKRATNAVNRMWQTRTPYFKVWDKEIASISDNEIAQRSEARKTEVRNQFSAASSQFDASQNGFESLLGYLRDIRKALSTDLTRDGLASVKSSVATANERSQTVKAALVQSAASFDELSTRTASFKVQEAK